MNISKISRSIVVVIFVAVIIFLGYFDIVNQINAEQSSGISSNLIKIIYFVILITLVLIFAFIKEKLYKLNVKRKYALIIRYIYISIVLISTSIIKLYQMVNIISLNRLIIYTIISIIISIIIKKIIFNVSKSDILSVFGMFTFSMLLNVITDSDMYFMSIMITLFVTLAIFVIQKLLDELKQRGITTKKYIIFSVLLGACIGICIILGINTIVWLIIALCLFFITINLDKTHINFPQKIMTSINKEQREKLYKIERININKLIISLLVIIILASFIFVVYEIIGNNISQNTVIINIANSEVKTLNSGFDVSNITSNLTTNATIFTSLSKTYYMLLFIYILFMEILAVVLRRRYDTKSTIIKLIFVLIFLSVSLFNLNIIYFQPLFTVLLILIAIVNTSNIYLNREERIKMLVSSK